MFTLIEFDERDGGGLAVVQESWLTPRKKETYWPPIKDQKLYEKLVRDISVKPSSDWTLYAIGRKFYETADYKKALEKLKLAQISSDLASDAEPPEVKPKRQVKRPIRYSTSEDEEDSISILQRPPPIHLRQIAGESASPTSSCVSTPNKYKRFIIQGTQGSSKELGETYETETITTPNSSNAVILDTNTSTSAELSLTTTAFQKKLFSQLLLIQQQNEKILTALEEKFPTKNSTALELPINLPLQTADDLIILENFLQNNSKSFVKNISHCGGKDVPSSTYRILNKILADELAQSYNYFGKRSGKQSFNSLKLKSCIVEAVLSSTEGATEFAIEESIRGWLKHATDRIKRKSKQTK